MTAGAVCREAAGGLSVEVTVELLSGWEAGTGNRKCVWGGQCQCPVGKNLVCLMMKDSEKLSCDRNQFSFNVMEIYNIKGCVAEM